jgi:hypothetical protein
MQATARRLSVVSATSCARRRLIRNVSPREPVKSFIHVLAIVAFSSPVLADPNEDEQRFLTIEGADKSFYGRDEQKFKKADLPPAFVAILDGLDWGTANGASPDSFVGYALDLNRDGKNEYFIETIYGGSGGPAFVVLAETGKKWRTIMDFQGAFHIIPVKDGWPRIVTTGRGGGGTFSKMNHHYEGTAYRATSLERYTRGVITKEIMPKPKG